jgi:hypothetical protein
MTIGSITLNELIITETDSDPTVVGLAAPIGSVALLDGGARKWQKFGPNDTDWKEDNVAANISFDNTGNGFTANEVQSAIEEAKTNAEGFPRAGLSLTSNGTLSTGNYITYTELLANPRILFPVTTRIKEITWVNVNTNLGAFTFQIYKNGQALGNLFYTYTPTAANRTVGYGYFVFPIDLDYAAGDSMYIKYVKPSGTSLADLALVVWISRIQ